MEETQLCSTGPTPCWPETPQCPNKPTTWLFGDAYCSECADKLIKLHALLNTTKV
jgi:hypothetical protein